MTKEESELNLLSEYMNWWIDRLKPVKLDIQLKIYSKFGYIEEGRNPNQLPTFERWKTLSNKFKEPI